MPKSTYFALFCTKIAFLSPKFNFKVGTIHTPGVLGHSRGAFRTVSSLYTRGRLPDRRGSHPTRGQKPPAEPSSRSKIVLEAPLRGLTEIPAPLYNICNSQRTRSAAKRNLASLWQEMIPSNNESLQKFNEYVSNLEL